MIRDLEPAGITISVGGEIGEVGGKNSTVEELRAFMDGYREALGKSGTALKGISKISVQTGTTHGGIPLADGSVARVKLDFETLEKLSAAARADYGLAGAVQHGASTLPDEAFDRFPATGTAEVHLATGFQNIVYDSKNFPDDLRVRIYDYLKREAASEMKAGDTEEQFFYKTRKKGLGPFKKEIWELPGDGPCRPRRGTGGAVCPPLQETQCGRDSRDGEPFRSARGCPFEAPGGSCVRQDSFFYRLVAPSGKTGHFSGSSRRSWAGGRSRGG